MSRCASQVGSRDLSYDPQFCDSWRMYFPQARAPVSQRKPGTSPPPRLPRKPLGEQRSRADWVGLGVAQGFRTRARVTRSPDPARWTKPMGSLMRGFREAEGGQSWLVPLPLGERSGRQGGLPGQIPLPFLTGSSPQAADGRPAPRAVVPGFGLPLEALPPLYR